MLRGRLCLRAYPDDIEEEVTGSAGTSMSIGSALEGQISFVPVGIFNISKVFSRLRSAVSTWSCCVLVFFGRFCISCPPYVPFSCNWVFGSLQQTKQMQILKSLLIAKFWWNCLVNMQEKILFIRNIDNGQYKETWNVTGKIIFQIVGLWNIIQRLR